MDRITVHTDLNTYEVPFDENNKTRKIRVKKNSQIKENYV